MSDELFEEGMAARRAYFGDAAVDKAMADQSVFNQEFQDFNTRNVWGAVWARPGLDFRMRSLLTVAIFAALGRPAEQQALYVRAALRNGVTPDEILEVILHAAAYCGASAASVTSRVAQDILREGGDELGGDTSKR